MLTATHRFEMLVTSLRKKLKLQPHESLFCYIGNVFSPALDETVENLWRVSLLVFRIFLFWLRREGGFGDEWDAC